MEEVVLKVNYGIMKDKKIEEKPEVNGQPQPAQTSEKERAMMIVKAQIAHWRKLEEITGVSKELVAKKIGGLKMVLSYIEKH